MKDNIAAFHWADQSGWHSDCNASLWLQTALSLTLANNTGLVITPTPSVPSHRLSGIHRCVILSRLQVLCKEAVRNRCQFLVAWITLALVPGVTNFRDAQPLFLSDFS